MLRWFQVLAAAAAAAAAGTDAESARRFPPDTLILDAAAPELRFTDRGTVGPACVGSPDWNAAMRCVSLPDEGDAVEFYLPTVRPGRYLIALHCRTGHQAGRWEYCEPSVRYTIAVDAEPVEMIRGVAVPELRFRGQGWYDYSGWVVSRDLVEIRPFQRIKVTTGAGYAYVLELALLTPQQAMAADWLVPDVAGKMADSIRAARGGLDSCAAQAQRLSTALTGTEQPIPPFAPILAQFDAAAADHTRRLDLWRAAFRRAREAGADAEIVELQRQLAGLRRQASLPLNWIRVAGTEWCRAVGEQMSALEPVPGTNDYHARWAAILRDWIDAYAADLRAPLAADTDASASGRRLGRALRCLDLRVRYQREVRAASAPAVTAARSARTEVVTPQESRSRPTRVCLNGLWDFAAGTDPAVPPATWETLRVPHGPWRLTYGESFNHGRDWDRDRHVGWYRTRFPVPPSWAGGSVRVRFEAVFHYAEVYVNGRFCGSHLGGFDRFTVDASAAVRPGAMNEMLVMVKDTWDTKTDPARNSRDDYSPNFTIVNDLWGVNYGGIWQDVFLEQRPSRARIETVGITTPVRNGIRLELDAVAANGSARARTLKLRFAVLNDTDAVAVIETEPRALDAGATASWAVQRSMPDAVLWGIGGSYGDPHLYRLRTQLMDGDRVVDERYDPFGFSQLWIEDREFVLNGQKLFLAGGGIWYLQERKFPLGNRFFASHLFRMDRAANIGIERIHRHGDVSQQYFAEASELGMLLEPETNPAPLTSAPRDVLGGQDMEDPVWRPHLEAYYRVLAGKHRNWPCTGLISVDNETFSNTEDEELMQLALDMVRIVRSVDPLRLTSIHGNHLMAAHSGPAFVNLHYAGSRTLTAAFEKAAGRPLINGEHNMGGHSLANNRDRAVAARGEQDLAAFWRREISGYLGQGAAGLFVFIPAFQAYCTTSDWRKTTPWGDMFQDLSGFSRGDDRWSCNFSAAVNVPWPSLSGPDAKAERVTVAATRCTFNWFDPERAVCTPNTVHDALRESFPALAPCRARRCQEALVTVLSDGAPVVGAMVTLLPENDQPVLVRGAITDPQGTAWIVPRLPGRYTVRVFVPGGRAAPDSALILRRYDATRAGYEDVLVRTAVTVR